VPKALVELDGVAMLERVLTRMKSYGIGEAVVNVHHFADKVRDFLREHDDFGMRLHISDESGMLLDTGGGVAAAADWLSGDEPVLLHNADIYTDVDFVEMQRVYEASGADATLLTSHRATSRYLLFDKNMRMHGWTDIRSGRVRQPGWGRWRLEGFILYLPAWLRIYAVMAGPMGRRCFRLLTIISSRAAGCI